MSSGSLRAGPAPPVKQAADEGAYDRRMNLKPGPMTVEYQGALRMDEIDQASRRAILRIQAKALNGQVGATARMRSQLAPERDGRTRVIVGNDLEVSGASRSWGAG